METGYDPHRIQELGRHTATAIDALTGITSSDRAAADAIRSVQLLRRNLEEHWMPLIRQIETSTAMAAWTMSGLTGLFGDGRTSPIGWLTRIEDRRPGRTRSDRVGPISRYVRPWTRHSDLTDDELFDLLDATDAALRCGDPSERPTDPELRALSIELATRAGDDPDFATDLVSMAPIVPTIALATTVAEFAGGFTSRVVVAMLTTPTSSIGADMALHRHATEAAMTVLTTEHPSACLDTLLDPAALEVLAGSDVVDTDVARRFVAAGLYDAVADDNERLPDGYDVLRGLIPLTNGPLDGGLQPGMARGVADAMTGYVDTLAPGIGPEGGWSSDRDGHLRADGYGSVLVDTHPADPDATDEVLGTYRDVTDLFGALLRDDQAQIELGMMLGAYTADVIAREREQILADTDLAAVINLADLLADARRNEQAELFVRAAADRDTRQRIGGLIGFGISKAVGAVATGAGLPPTVGTAVAHASDQAADAVVDHESDIEPDPLPGASIALRTPDNISVAVVAFVIGDPTVRGPLGLAGIGDDVWEALDEELDRIDGAPGGQRRQRVQHLRDKIRRDAPALGDVLFEVDSITGMAELLEARNPVDPD